MYWTDLVRHERRMRAKFSLAVPYHCLTVFDTRGDFRSNGFPQLTKFWRLLEVPRGCNVELPPVFTYKAKELMDSESGWWVVAYTEFVLRVAAYLLFDAYDNIRLWAVSPDLLRCVKDLDLEGPLGSAANAKEARLIFSVVEATRFEKDPERWRQRENYECGSIGRTKTGADFIY